MICRGKRREHGVCLEHCNGARSMKNTSVQTRDLDGVSQFRKICRKHWCLLGVHLLRSQLRILSAVELKCVGFSLIRSRIMVVSREELDSVRTAGPLSSIDKSIDWTVSETATNGTMLRRRRTSIK